VLFDDTFVTPLECHLLIERRLNYFKVQIASFYG